MCMHMTFIQAVLECVQAITRCIQVLSCPGARELLLSAGFAAQNVGMIARPELLVLPDDAGLEELAQARTAVQTVLANLPADQ